MRSYSMYKVSYETLKGEVKTLRGYFTRGQSFDQIINLLANGKGKKAYSWNEYGRDQEMTI